MRLPGFEYLEPTSVEQACALLAEDPDGSAVYAGGTDVLVYMKEGAQRHRRLVSLARIAGLGRVECSAETGLVIGAMATVNQVARHRGVQAAFPGVVDAARSLAADQVRNLATVVGNLCMAVPSADMAPILLAHDAQVRVVSPDGERTIPLRELFVGPRQSVLAAANVVVAINAALPEKGTGDASVRQGGRASLSLPIASAAAVVAMDGGVCRRASIALGAVAPTPILVPAIGECLAGRELTSDVLDEAAELARAAARPIDDLRATKEYRRELVGVLARRALIRAAARASGTGTGAV